MDVTQAIAGEMLGVTRVTIQNWEAGTTRIPIAVESMCDMHEKRLKMRSDYGPVTLIYHDAPLWQPLYGPARVPRVSRELYPNNESALSRVGELMTGGSFHNPLIIDESGDVVWTSKQILERAIMPWYQVVIKDGDVADTSASALIEKFSQKYHATNEITKDVTVHHRKMLSGGHVYYFSPAAAVIAKEVLTSSFGGAPCTAPDLSGLVQIAL